MPKEFEPNERELVITDENGIESTCEILFTHTHEGKQYVIFQFLESEEISAALYFPGEDESEGTFADIETEAEWDMLDEVVDAYFAELEAEEEDNDA